VTAPLAPRFRPGEIISASKLDELGQLAEQALRVRGGADAYSGGAGQSFSSPGPQSFWARTDGTRGGAGPFAHGFTEVQEAALDDGTFVEKTDGVSGTVTASPLYEVNGQVLAANTVVRAWKGYGDYYLCVMPAVTPAGGGSATWYTSYQHLTEPTCSVGDVVPPGAQIATIALQDGGGHLHFGLGDGQNIGSSTGSGPSVILSVTGQTQEVADWFPFPYVNTRDPSAPGPALPSAFSPGQLAWIKARTSSPVGDAAGWVALLGSPFHASYEYYCLDLNLLPLAAEGDVGHAVYNACTGADVETVCVLKAELSNGWICVLRHNGSGSGPVYGDTFINNFYLWVDGGDSPTTYTTDVVTNVCPELGETLEWVVDELPAHSDSPGTAGQICFDREYVYICVRDGTWVRAAVEDSF